MRAIEDAILVAFVAAVIYTDWRWRRIPNAFTYPVMVVGLVLGAFEGLPGDIFAGGLFDHVAGLVVGFLVAYPFYAAGGLKAGDGKYLMAVGAIRGLGFLLYAAIVGALIGGVIALGVIAVRRMRPADGPSGSVMKVWIPYGVALGLGTLLGLALELSGGLSGATL
ncbi:MAG TPA: A24 family peptidase [Candidatus Limnocylindria bacterium]|nr:A24 family peptidase [Candidatus Limnocylindria bacterium]